MQHIHKHLAITGCLLALVACGGGGGGNMSVINPPDMIPWWVDDVEEYRTLTGTGAPPSDLDSEAIASRVEERAAAANSLLLGDFLTLTFEGDFARVDSWTCNGTTCTGTYHGDTISDDTVEVSLGPDGASTPFVAAFEPEGVNFENQAIAADGEIVLFQSYSTGTIPRNEDASETADVGMWVYGGWGQYNFFLVEGGNHGAESDFAYGGILSAGAASDSNPATGSGTWNGVMIGQITDGPSENVGDAIYGNAEITIDDFTNPEVDVAFTEIQDINDNENTIADMTWSDIPLTNGGFKDEASDSRSMIEGQFYGPAHEEVGGVFFHDDIQDIQGVFSGAER